MRNPPVAGATLKLITIVYESLINEIYAYIINTFSGASYITSFGGHLH